MGEQDVLRLDVAVDHAFVVGELESFGRFPGDPERLLHGERPSLRSRSRSESPRTNGMVNQRRGELFPARRGDLARVVDRADVRMMEPGGGLYLEPEPLGTERGAELRTQQLERDGTLVLEIAGEIDRGHAAAPELALERELAPERAHDVAGWVVHDIGRGHAPESATGEHPLPATPSGKGLNSPAWRPRPAGRCGSGSSAPPSAGRSCLPGARDGTASGRAPRAPTR